MPDAHGACVIFIVGFAVGLTPGCRRGRGLLHHPRRLYAIRILWRRRRTLRCPPIDRLEKHRQLRSAQTHRSALGPGPNESSPAPQSLIKQTEAVLAIPENLDFVASTPTKDKNLTGVRVCVATHTRTYVPNFSMCRPLGSTVRTRRKSMRFATECARTATHKFTDSPGDSTRHPWVDTDGMLSIRRVLCSIPDASSPHRLSHNGECSPPEHDQARPGSSKDLLQTAVGSWPGNA